VKTPSLPGADFATIMPSKQDVTNLTGFENSAKFLAFRTKAKSKKMGTIHKSQAECWWQTAENQEERTR